MMTEITERPKKGDRYVVNTGFQTHVLTMWHAPFTGGHQAFLPAGLEFIVDFDPSDTATAASASAEPYDKWEPVLVPQEDRAAEKYNGYYLVIPFTALAAICSRL